MVLSQHSQPEDRPPCTKSRLLRNWRCANTWAKDSGTKAYKGSNEWEGEMYGHVLVACPLYFWGLLPSTLSAGVWSTKKLLDLKNPPSTKQKQFPPSIYTPPKFNLAPKKRFTWRTTTSHWVSVTFRGQTAETGCPHNPNCSSHGDGNEAALEMSITSILTTFGAQGELLHASRSSRWCHEARSPPSKTAEIWRISGSLN